MCCICFECALNQLRKRAQLILPNGGSKFNSKFLLFLSIQKGPSQKLNPFLSLIRSSVTRLGDLLDFGQLFKACGNNYFAQISHILQQIFVKIFYFSSELIFGRLL